MKAGNDSLYRQKENISLPSHQWDQGLKMKAGSVKKTILHFFPPNRVKVGDLFKCL